MSFTEKFIEALAPFEQREMRVMGVEVSITTFRAIQSETTVGLPSVPPVILPRPTEPPKLVGQLYGVDLWVRPEKATPAQKVAAVIREALNNADSSNGVNMRPALTALANYLEKQ